METNTENPEPKTSTGAALRDRSDLAVALLLAAANLFVLLVCWKIQGIQADESTYIYGALQMLKGAAIYRDFWVFYPPGIFFLIAGAFGLFGESLFAARLVLILGASAATAVLYLLGRRFMPRLPSAVASILFITIGVNLWPVSGHHWNSTFALIFSAYFMACFLEQPRNRFLVWSGLFAGATLLLQLHKGTPLVAVTLLILLVKSIIDIKSPRDSTIAFIKAGLLFSLCSLIPVGLTVLYLLKCGVLREAIGAVILFPFRQLAGMASPDYGVPYGAFSVDMLRFLMKFLNVPGITKASVRAVAAIITIIAPLSAILVPGVVFLRKKLSAPGEFVIPIFVALAALACLAASVSRPDFHHLVSAMPLSYLTLAFAISSIAPARITDTKAALMRGVRGASFAILLVPAAWVGAGTLLYGLHVKMLYLDSPLGFVPLASEKELGPMVQTPYESLITSIKMNTAPDEKIFVMPSSAFLYYLTERESASRFPMLLSSMRDNAQMVEIIAELELDQTRLVILDPAASWRQFKAALPYADEREFRENPLLRYIHQNYKKIGDHGAFQLMKRTN